MSGQVQSCSWEVCGSDSWLQHPTLLTRPVSTSNIFKNCGSEARKSITSKGKFASSSGSPAVSGPLWDKARKTLMTTTSVKSKCGAKCRHGGRWRAASSSMSNSPTNSPPNSPPRVRHLNESSNSLNTLPTSQPVEIPKVKQRSNSLTCQGSIYSSGPPSRHAMCLLSNSINTIHRKPSSRPISRRGSSVASPSHNLTQSSDSSLRRRNSLVYHSGSSGSGESLSPPPLISQDSEMKEDDNTDTTSEQEYQGSKSGKNRSSLCNSHSPESGSPELSNRSSSQNGIRNGRSNSNRASPQLNGTCNSINPWFGGSCNNISSGSRRNSGNRPRQSSSYNNISSSINPQLGSSCSDIRNINPQLGSSCSDISSINPQLGSSCSDISSINPQLGSSCSDISSINPQLGSSCSDICSINPQLGSSCSDISSINPQLGSSCSDISSINPQLGSSCSDICSINPQLGSSCSDISSINPQLGSSCSDISSINPQLGSSCSDISSINPQLGTSCSDISSINPQLGSSYSDISSINPQLGSSCSDIRSINPQLGSSCSDICSINPQLGNSCSDISNINPQLSSSCSDISGPRHWGSCINISGPRHSQNNKISRRSRSSSTVSLNVIDSSCGVTYKERVSTRGNLQRSSKNSVGLNSRSSSTTSLNVTEAAHDILSKGNGSISSGSPWQRSISGIRSGKRSSSTTTLNTTDETHGTRSKGNGSISRGNPRQSSISSINRDKRSSSTTNLTVPGTARDVLSKDKGSNRRASPRHNSTTIKNSPRYSSNSSLNSISRSSSITNLNGTNVPHDGLYKGKGDSGQNVVHKRRRATSIEEKDLTLVAGGTSDDARKAKGSGGKLDMLNCDQAQLVGTDKIKAAALSSSSNADTEKTASATSIMTDEGKKTPTSGGSADAKKATHVSSCSEDTVERVPTSKSSADLGKTDTVSGSNAKVGKTASATSGCIETKKVAPVSGTIANEKKVIAGNRDNAAVVPQCSVNKLKGTTENNNRLKNRTDTGKKSKDYPDNDKKTRNLYNTVKKVTLASDGAKKLKSLVNNAKKSKSLLDVNQEPKALSDGVKKPKSLSSGLKKPKNSPNVSRKPQSSSDNTKKPQGDMKPHISPEVMKPKSSPNPAKNPQSSANDFKKSKNLSDMKAKSLPEDMQKLKSVAKMISNVRSSCSMSDVTKLDQTPFSKVQKLNAACDKPMQVQNGSSVSADNLENAVRSRADSFTAEAAKEGGGKLMTDITKELTAASGNEIKGNDSDMIATLSMPVDRNTLITHANEAAALKGIEEGLVSTTVTEEDPVALTVAKGVPVVLTVAEEGPIVPTVADAGLVELTITEEGPVVPTVTDEWLIAPTVTEEGPVAPTVTDEWLIAPTVTEEGPVAPTVTDEWLIAPTVTEEGPVAPTVTDEWLIAPTVTEEGPVAPTVTDEWLIAPTVTEEGPVAPTVTDEWLIAPPVIEEKPVELTITEEKSVTQTAASEERSPTPADTEVRLVDIHAADKEEVLVILEDTETQATINEDEPDMSMINNLNILPLCTSDMQETCKTELLIPFTENIPAKDSVEMPMTCSADPSTTNNEEMLIILAQDMPGINCVEMLGTCKTDVPQVSQDEMFGIFATETLVTSGEEILAKGMEDTPIASTEELLMSFTPDLPLVGNEESLDTFVADFSSVSNEEMMNTVVADLPSITNEEMMNTVVADLPSVTNKEMMNTVVADLPSVTNEEMMNTVVADLPSVSNKEMMNTFVADLPSVTNEEMMNTVVADLPSVTNEEMLNTLVADLPSVNNEEMMNTFVEDLPSVSNEEMLNTFVADLPSVTNEEMMNTFVEDMLDTFDEDMPTVCNEDTLKAEEFMSMTEATNSDAESCLWEDFHRELDSPNLSADHQRPANSNDYDYNMSKDFLVSSRWHGCEDDQHRNFDTDTCSRDSSSFKNMGNFSSRCSSICSDRSESSRSSSRSGSSNSRGRNRNNEKATGRYDDLLIKHSGSFEADYGRHEKVMDEGPLSSSVGEDFLGSLMGNSDRQRGEDLTECLRREKTKHGSLTNIHDSSRHRWRKMKYAYNASKSLCNIHDSMSRSISNLNTAHYNLTGSTNRLNATDNIQEKLDSVRNKYSGRRSTSCLNLDRMTAWNSTTKHNGGWDNVKQNLAKKDMGWNPKRDVGEPYEGERHLPEKIKTGMQGWDKLRCKMLEKKRQNGMEKGEIFKQGGGEEESEWLNTREDSGKGCMIKAANTLQHHPPRFSEIFSVGKEVQKAHEQMVSMPADTDNGKRKKSKKKKLKGKGTSKDNKDHKNGSNKIKWKYVKPLSTSCSISMDNYGMELVKNVEESLHSDVEEKRSQESGIGSSFDEDDSSSDSRSSSSGPPSPSTPHKVFEAITHYLRSVDLVESEEDVDNFSREAEIFDPEELMLLTDNEDTLSWMDIIVSTKGCSDGRKRSGCSEDDIDNLKLDFLTGKNNDIKDEKVAQTLGQLLGNNFPDLGCSPVDASTCSSSKLQAEHSARCEETDVSYEVDPILAPAQPHVHGPALQNAETILQQDNLVIGGDKDVAVIDDNIEGKSENTSAQLDSDPSPVTSDSINDAATTEDTDTSGARGRSLTKEGPQPKESGTSGERSVSCSKNIRTFLLSQPCAHSHKEGVTHPGCSDKHVLDVTAVEEPECQSDCSVKKKKSRKSSKKKALRRAAEARRQQRQQTAAPTFWSRLFCTTPLTVEGTVPELESNDTDPEPLPPPIPPHSVDPASIPEVQPTSCEQVDPDIMTADEAQRLLSAKEAQGLLSDEEAQEVVLLLSPQEHDTSKCVPPVPPHHPEVVPGAPPHFSDAPPAVPPHYAEGAPPVPPHFTPGEDEYDTRVASHFDPTLTSPLSPEDEPSEADSSEISGDVYQVSRVKEVLVEDGVHYLEDGHFWVEVPGLPDDDEDEDNDPSIPFHPHTKLTFSKDPVQVFSTYSVTEYDRKNDDVDPVAASAEYELEKRVEKMDLFPVEIVKGEGGLGLSIIGMGVGADAGVEKLGIFVKTITAGGATERDGRIQVNDQIIEVDGKSLVGVTQVFAASVLKNTSGRVHFLIGREKDPENSEVALLIKQSLQADREREERRRALGGPDYDPHTGHSLFDPLSSPSEENSRSEEASVQHNYASYLEGATSPTSPDATSPHPEVFDLEGDTSDTSPENDVSMLKMKLKEAQYRHAVAEAEVTKLKMTLLEMEKVVTENTQYTSQLLDAQNKMAEMDCQLQSKVSEVSTYQDMLEQSQGQFIVLEKKYYKAKKIIKEYQGRERDFLHREEYHITQLEEKDSHYNALVKALKDRVIHLEGELTSVQKKAGMPVQVGGDVNAQPGLWNLQQSNQSALSKQPPCKPSLCTLDPEISDTETSDTGTLEGDKANTVERKLPVKEELDEAVPPHELLDVSASRAKGELASRGGLANRHLPSLKKTTSMSSASSQDQSLDDSSLDDDLPEAVKHPPPAEATQDGQQDQGSRRSAEPQESSLPPHSPPHTTSSTTQAKSPQPPSYTQATMGSVSHLGSPPPYHHPPGQFASPRQPFTSSHILSDPSIGLPMRPLGVGSDAQTHESRSESRPEIPYRHPPPVARVQPVNRAEISESASLAAHLANRTPQQQSLAEQLKALLAERELDSDGTQHRNDREASPSKRSPTSLMEDVRQAVLQADVSPSVSTQQYWQHLGKKPVISAPVPLSSTAHVVAQGQIVHPVGSPQRSQSAFYSPGGRESLRDSSGGSPRLGRSSIHTSPLGGVSANPSGVVLLSQRPLDSSLPTHKLAPGVDGSSGDLSSGPASLGSGDEGSGASLGSQSSLSLTQPPTERTKRSHMWQTAPVVDWTKEQVSQWLVVQGLESCVGRFQDIGMTGPRLLNLDIRDLKSLGLPAEDKSKLKRKVKELRLAVEKERKQAEKEKKERERLQKKAEKLAEKAEKKKK
ncbi:serine-rich adhesin for platelets isoform X4 [Procambarus clarkii]|uniref:serine-rich adhesin for platelets isoform X4 n=1 Tax=Procambarus clarkii TaxID=6728 RepID=UPI0037440322